MKTLSADITRIDSRKQILRIQTMSPYARRDKVKIAKMLFSQLCATMNATLTLHFSVDMEFHHFSVIFYWIKSMFIHVKIVGKLHDRPMEGNGHSEVRKSSNQIVGNDVSLWLFPNFEKCQSSIWNRSSNV